MFLQRLLAAVSIDPQEAMESADPFYVPGRTAELIPFATAIGLSLMIPVALFTVPLNPQNLGVIAIAAVQVLLAFLTGRRARQRRLLRAEQVNKLRLGLRSGSIA